MNLNLNGPLKNLLVSDQIITEVNITDPTTEKSYIFLDNTERKRFSQSSHSYLVEQVQIHSPETASTNKDYTLTIQLNSYYGFFHEKEPTIRHNYNGC